jgi:hypothetical protein
MVTPSRRNSAKGNFDGPTRTSILNLLRYLKYSKIPTSESPYTLLSSGLLVNGRKLKSQDHIEYLPFVNRRTLHCRQVGSTEAYCVGTIERFHVFHLGTDQELVLVELIDRPIRGMIRSLYVVDSITDHVEGVASRKKFVHIDSVTARIRLVPHFDDPDLACAIRFWETR